MNLTYFFLSWPIFVTSLLVTRVLHEKLVLRVLFIENVSLITRYWYRWPTLVSSNLLASALQARQMIKISIALQDIYIN